MPNFSAEIFGVGSLGSLERSITPFGSRSLYLWLTCSSAPVVTGPPTCGGINLCPIFRARPSRVFQESSNFIEIDDILDVELYAGNPRTVGL